MVKMVKLSTLFVVGITFFLDILSVCRGSLNLKLNSRLQHTRKIIGGLAVETDACPFNVGIRRHRGNETCNGALITLNAVLTTASCVKQIKGDPLIGVVAGALYRNLTDGLLAVIKEIIPHPDYKIKALDPYDLAILILNTPFEFSETIQPIELAKDRWPGEQYGVIFGWGRIWSYQPGNITGTEVDESRYPEKLMAVELPIIADKNCSALYSDYDSVPAFNGTWFCAGEAQGGRSACHGDSGSGFVVNATLYGITLWHSNPCGDTDLPATFIHIPTFYPWIKETLKSRNIEIQ